MGGSPITTVSNVGRDGSGGMNANISNRPLGSKPPSPPADFGGKDAGPPKIPPGGEVPIKMDPPALGKLPPGGMPLPMKKGGKIDLNDCKISTHEKSKSSKDW
jgi:hypothetical protein